MKLWARFLLIILTATCICIAGVIFGLSKDILSFWEEETQAKIASSKSSFISSMSQLTEVASASASLIGEDELISRYFSPSEVEPRQHLADRVQRYLKTLLAIYPYFDEITLIQRDGLESMYVSRGFSHSDNITKSELVVKAWANPTKSFVDFEFDNDNDVYHLNLYRAITPKSLKTGQSKNPVKTVVKISIDIGYLENLAWQQLMTQRSFVAIYNPQRNVVVRAGAEIPESLLADAIESATFIEDAADTYHVLVDEQALFGEWRLIVGVPMDDAFRSIRVIATKGATTLFIFFTILAIIIFVVLSRLIIRPINLLVGATKKYSEHGELPTFAERKDEIGELQQAFLAMGEKVHSQTNSLREQAYTDNLTGLPNRNVLEALLKKAIFLSEKNARKVGLLFIDLDGFKQVNDVLGHTAGDSLLQKVAERLNSILRTGDAVAHLEEDVVDGGQSLVRLGGDEFTVVLPDLRFHEDAAIVGKRLLDQFQYPFRILGKEVFVGASIGIALYPDDANTINELIKCADTAMYSAKSSGKMRYVFFDGGMSNDSKAMLEIENVLHHAFEANEFKVAYQPKVNPFSRKVTGFEALARLESKKVGAISPADFIPIAEKSGLIDNLTLLMIEEVCHQVITMQREIDRDFKMSLNISPGQLANTQLFRDIKTVVKNMGIHPSFIELEVTENSLIENEEIAEKQLSALRRMGFRTALDDFGVGYSSLGHLRRFEFDTLKIDRIFFNDISKNSSGRTILISIIEMAKQLGMEIVAEGIETKAQLEFVRDNNIHLVQGFFFSKPEYSEKLPEVVETIENSNQSDIFLTK